MKVSVLGSGNGGCAIAYDWAYHGHEVRLAGSTNYTNRVNEFAEAGGIRCTGELAGFGPLAYSGEDVGEALEPAELVFIAGPAFAIAPLAERAKPHLRPGQAIVVCPTSCVGSAVFKQAIGLPVDDTTYTVGETSTLPYAIRVNEKGTIHLYKKIDDGLTVAGLPHPGTDRLVELLSPVYPYVKPAESIFQTSLQNGNPVIHPSVTLMNAALIERTGGDFQFYWEGVTPAVGRMMRAVDQERMAIGKALRLTIVSEPALGVAQGYMAAENYADGYNRGPGFKGIKAQGQLDHRYLTEDVGYSLIFWSDLARKLGVETPAIEALITMASVALERDFRGEAARTLANTGMGDLSVEELHNL